jgi:hypothetical protein
MPVSVRRDPFGFPVPSGGKPNLVNTSASGSTHPRADADRGYAYPPDITPLAAYRSRVESANRGDLGVICDGCKMGGYFFRVIWIACGGDRCLRAAMPTSCSFRQARSMSYPTCFGRLGCCPAAAHFSSVVGGARPSPKNSPAYGRVGRELWIWCNPDHAAARARSERYRARPIHDQATLYQQRQMGQHPCPGRPALPEQPAGLQIGTLIREAALNMLLCGQKDSYRRKHEAGRHLG